MTDRIKEAEEAAKAWYPVENYISVPYREGFTEGYLAACEKLEGERDEFAAKVIDWMYRRNLYPYIGGWAEIHNGEIDDDNTIMGDKLVKEYLSDQQNLDV